MKTYYGKLVDKVIPPKMERRFHVGRRSVEDRRLMEEDRRSSVGGDFLYSQSERREREIDRRRDDLHEPRQRWFKVNRWQSRHF